MIVSSISPVNFRPYSMQRVHFGDNSDGGAVGSLDAADPGATGKKSMGKGTKIALGIVGGLAFLLLVVKSFLNKKTKESEEA